MIRRPPRSTRTTHSFPTRRSSDLRHPDGSTRYFRINGRPYFAADGSFLGYRGTGTDTTFEVTARREIEARIELQEAVLEAVGQGISVVDASLTVAAFNRRFVELLDLPPGKLRQGAHTSELQPLM